ncbi:MAG: zf-HC2 domain-containing protein [Candidatus Acidiferrales bacterium]
MNCFPEFTYSVYLDDELPREEALRVEAHLEACAACRTLLESLRAENRVLVEVLRQAPAGSAALAARASLFDLLGVTAVLVVAVALLEAGTNWISETLLPTGADWANPFSLSGQFNLFFAGFFYFLKEGAVMFLTSFSVVAVLVVSAAAVAVSFYWLRRRPAGVAILAALAVALLLPQPGAALESRTKKHGGALVIAPNETIDDTLLFGGETLIVNGTITGNLIAFGERVEINGTVKGDVVCFSGPVYVKGKVEGNLFSFSHFVEVTGRIGGSAHAFAQYLDVEREGTVQGDAFAFVGDASVDGTVGRDLRTFSGATHVAGTVGRHLRARTGRLRVSPGAHVGGNVDAYVRRATDIQIDPGAVAGKVETHLAPSRWARYTRMRFYLWQAVKVAAAFLTGLAFFCLFPALFSLRLESGGAALRRMGVGFLALVAPPAAIVLACLTLVGLPLGLLGLAVWLAALYLAKVFVGVYVGQALTATPVTQLSSFARTLLVGLLVVFVAINLPFLGKPVHFLVLLLGLGLAICQARALWRRTPAAA